MELIIYNTDVDHPIILGEEIKEKFPEKVKNIKIINNNVNYLTKEDYTNIGDIRRDSLSHASGIYYICWDDDDVFLPWNVRQCVDGLQANSGAWAWKPERSMMWPSGQDPKICGNVMEASIIARLDKIRQYGFVAHQGGGEHLDWIQKFTTQHKFHIEKNSIPGYSFNWADQGKMRGHKQSGTIDRADNFEYHKKNTTDHAKRPVEIFGAEEVNKIYQTHIASIKKQIGVTDSGYTVSQELFDKYVKKYEMILMHFNFIEIGTCDYDTLLEKLGDTKVGISVEPIQDYLEKLPNKPNVIKVNAAISSEDKDIDLFYVPPENQIKYNIPFTKGWGTVQKPHRSHGDPTSLLKDGVLKKSKIKSLTFKTLCETYDVESVDWVKIDTEGHDCIVVNSILDYEKVKPQKISFEQTHCDKSELEATKNNLFLSGYQLTNRDTEEDLIYQLNKNKTNYYPKNANDKEASELFKNAWSIDFKSRLKLHLGGMESTAGYGTTYDATKPIIEKLPEIFSKYNIKKILDAPCGDYYIMDKAQFKDIQYLGIDLVQEQLDLNKQKYPGVNFQQLNMITDILPMSDLVFSRDILIHFSDYDIKKFIKNCFESGCKYLMTNTYTKIDKNQDMDGILGWRFINFEKYPFHFPTPIEIIKEGAYNDVGKSMALWKLHDLFNVL